MRQAPTGTVTFLFTDIEGSTRLLQALGRARYAVVHAEHHRLLRSVWDDNEGYEVDSEGDAFLVAFSQATHAVNAAVEAQHALSGAEWPDGHTVRVRIGIHSGEAIENDGTYVGVAVHRGARIASAAHGGQVLTSETTRELAVDEALGGIAFKDLGSHRLKDLTLPQRLYQVAAPGLRVDFPPLKTLENRPTNLPTQPTPLIGRAADIRDVEDIMLREEVRLVTLTGPGGTGKTRLALHVAAEVVEMFPDGVWFVNLAAASDSSLVLPTVAQALGIREEVGRQLLDTLADELAGKRTLLVLDNFEQVVDAADDVARLLVKTTALTFLVTSRTRLQLSAEHEYPVEALGADEALALFTERAQAVKPAFALNGNRPVVAEICSRLDHLPLAIELAASRIKLLPERALLQRLDQRLKVLAGGPRDLPERQRTLRAAIDWSFELLEPEQRRLFARLAVFAGGRSLDAVEQVCDPDSELDVLDGLMSLIDKSLLRQEESESGEPRFVMLETIHEYARERLEESGEAQAVRARHARYFLSLVQEALVDRHRSWRMLNALETEHSNIRAALAWAEGADPAMAMVLAAKLWRFWDLRGHLTEGLGWLRKIVVAEGTEEVRGEALTALAGLAYSAGELDEAVAASAESVRLLERVGSTRALGHALGLRGLALFESGRHAEARAALERSRDAARSAGEWDAVATATGNLGLFDLHAGNLDDARSAFSEVNEMGKRLDDREIVCIGHENLGIVALLAGRPWDAEHELLESLALATDIGYRGGFAYALIGLAATALDTERMERAATLLGVVDGILADVGIGLEVFERRLFDRVERSLAASGMRMSLEAQRESARGWSEERAVAYALAETVAGDRR